MNLTVGIVGRRSTVRVVGSYVSLMKPRIIELLLITTVPAMIVAKQGIPNIWLVVMTLVGGTLSAGGANAVNMWVDRDIDSIMKRTQKRPLVTGEISPSAALAFAVSLEVAAFLVLAVAVNLLSAVLSLAAALFYIFVYTLWLKRTSSQNIVIGGAAGAAPVLVGWAAVTNSVSWTPLIMFLIIFLWTPPHFWALAFRYKDDYAKANVPMLPAVATAKRTASEIVIYTVLLWIVTLVLVPVAHLGMIYSVSALALGGAFFAYTVRLYRECSPKLAMRVFSFSIYYLTLLFLAMGIDIFVRLR